MGVAQLLLNKCAATSASKRFATPAAFSICCRRYYCREEPEGKKLEKEKEEERAPSTAEEFERVAKHKQAAAATAESAVLNIKDTTPTPTTAPAGNKG